MQNSVGKFFFLYKYNIIIILKVKYIFIFFYDKSIILEVFFEIFF
jgi:hypothetical protein